MDLAPKRSTYQPVSARHPTLEGTWLKKQTQRNTKLSLLDEWFVVISIIYASTSACDLTHGPFLLSTVLAFLRPPLDFDVECSLIITSLLVTNRSVNCPALFERLKA